MQPVAVHQRAKALAAQTKPARAGVRCGASAELQLTANAGRCECYSWARMRTAGNALASVDAAMLCKWSPQGGVQRFHAELNAAAFDCRLAASRTTGSECGLLP